MKFYRVKFTVVNASDVPERSIAYLFSPLKDKKDVSRYMFNVWGKRYPKGFFLRDIKEISEEDFSRENTANLQTMILSVISEEDN